MRQLDFISIIIPCYNYGAFIGDTIASLQAQTHSRWEAIVVDDGSTDDTANQVSALAKMDSRIFYTHQKNQGVSVARNTGIVLARGEFVVFLDADDLLSSTQLQAHLENFRYNPDIDLSYSKLRYFSDNNPSKLFANYNLSTQKDPGRIISGCGRSTFPKLIRKNLLPLQSIMFRRKLLQKVGRFKEGMKALEDWDYVLRCVLRGACLAQVNDPTAVAMVRVHLGSATQTVNFVDYLDRVYENVRTEIQRLHEHGELDAARFYGRVLSETMVDSDRRRARRARKDRRKEVIQRIMSIGMLDFINLYPVFKQQRLCFLYAYLRVFIGRVLIFLIKIKKLFVN